ncbi:MAG: cytochrome c oxidase assembly factor Coa1 family protein [Chthoniobacterales bacterium]
MDPVPPPTTPPPLRPRPNWWSRNWKWLVPTGCGGCLVLIVAFAAVIVFVIIAGLKQSDAYKTALSRAKSDPAVIEALGSPINDGWFMTGSTHVEGPGGEANLGIPISGPKAKGTLYAVATKSAGRWTYTTLEVEVNGRSERINLLQQPGEER